METVLKITQEKNSIKIENKSKYVVELHLVPVKPKRKVHTQMVIHPDQYFIFDGVDEWNLSSHFFRFVKL